MKVIA